MNNALYILIAGRHQEIVPIVVRLLSQTTNWQPFGALTNEAAILSMNTQQVDVLLLSSGLSHEDEIQLKQHLQQTHPDAITIQHYGGGSGLLTAEIYEALKNK